jgi:hypothetical protein
LLDVLRILAAEFLHIILIGPLHLEVFSTLPILSCLAVANHAAVDDRSII